MTAEETVRTLDDWGVAQSLDTRNMLRIIDEMPEQFETALAIAQEFVVEPSEEPLSAMCVVAVAESATIAELAVVSMGENGGVPIVCNGTRPLPSFVGENTAVLVIDYHGKSETIIRNYRSAIASGARVFVATSGGRLLQLALADGVQVFRIPPGQPARTAVGYLFVPVVCIAQRLGLVTGGLEQVSSALLRLKSAREVLRFSMFGPRNIAKQVAEQLSDKAIAIYGPPGYGEVLARRWSAQIAANAKRQSVHGHFPDITLGDVSAWENANGTDQGIVFLTDPETTADSRALTKIAQELAPSEIIEVVVKGGSTVEKALYGLMFGDYVSCYLALLAEIDPNPMGLVQTIAVRLENPMVEVAETAADVQS